MPEKSYAKDVFLMGGQDLEMHQISKKARRSGAEVIDLALTQREASNEGVDRYKDKIEGIQNDGNVPVAIELAKTGEATGIEVVDHHNENTERPASLIQVLERLGLEPTFVDRLVVANDTGYIPAMESILEEEYIPKLRYSQGVDTAEARKKNLIELIRAKDRQTQGVTEEMENEAEEAIKHMEYRANGLAIVRVNGNNFAPVQDRLYFTGQSKNLVVVCSSDKEEKEVWFLGPGDVCKQIREYFQPQKDERAKNDPSDPSNEYHTVGSGAGYGRKGENALCLVVAKDPEEVVEYIEKAENQKSTSGS